MNDVQFIKITLLDARQTRLRGLEQGRYRVANAIKASFHELYCSLIEDQSKVPAYCKLAVWGL
jgi:hypothetical protein